MDIKVINRADSEMVFDLVVNDGNGINHIAEAVKLPINAFHLVKYNNPLWDAAPDMYEALQGIGQTALITEWPAEKRMEWIEAEVDKALRKAEGRKAQAMKDTELQDQLTLTKKALELACKHLVEDISCTHCPFDNKEELTPACRKPESNECIDAVYRFYLSKAGREV